MKRFFVFALTLALVAIFALSAGAAERKGMIGVGVGAGVGLPLGSFKDESKLGWRAGAGVGYFVTNQVAIGASGVFGQNSVKDTVLAQLKAIDSSVTGAKTQMLEFGAWLKYFFKMQNEKVAPYVKLGLGANNIKAKVETSGASVSASETFMGGNVGLGAMFSVSPTASIFVEAALHDYAKKNFSPFTYLAGQVGVAFMFGGSGGGTQ